MRLVGMGSTRPLRGASESLQVNAASAERQGGTKLRAECQRGWSVENCMCVAAGNHIKCRRLGLPGVTSVAAHRESGGQTPQARRTVYSRALPRITSIAGVWGCTV